MCTAQDSMALQRFIKTTQNFTDTHLLSISEVGELILSLYIHVIIFGLVVAFYNLVL